MARRQPVIAAWGAGVDSTAMIIELAARGEPPDVVLMADTGSERPETEAYVPLFRTWMDEHGIENPIVRYEPKRFKHWPPYGSLVENLLTNATLPSIAFNRHSCSLGPDVETVSFVRDEGRADRRANPKSWRWSARPSRRVATLVRQIRRCTKMWRLSFKAFVSESISLAKQWRPLYKAGEQKGDLWRGAFSSVSTSRTIFGVPSRCVTSEPSKGSPFALRTHGKR